MTEILLLNITPEGWYVYFHDQILIVPSLPADTRKSPVLSKRAHWTASSWPTRLEIYNSIATVVKSFVKSHSNVHRS